MSAPLRPLAALAMLTALAGCATIENGTDDDVSVVTDPPGARVNASTGTICTTPCTVTGPRKDTFVITITKAGYVSQTVLSESKPTADLEAASKNEFSADYLGRIIDVQDGSHTQHVPAAIVVKLDPAT